jgi:phage gpG-like protein
MLQELKILDAINSAIVALPNKIATEAVNFSKERFVQQNWVDSTTQSWAKRKNSRGSARRNKGAVLVDSGRLKRSIRKIEVSPTLVVIGTDVSYAKAHNNGFRGRKQVKTYNKRSSKGNVYKVRAHTVNVNLPRRRFLGESAVLNQRIERMATAEITRAIKKSI